MSLCLGHRSLEPVKWCHSFWLWQRCGSWICYRQAGCSWVLTIWLCVFPSPLGGRLGSWIALHRLVPQSPGQCCVTRCWSGWDQTGYGWLFGVFYNNIHVLLSKLVQDHVPKFVLDELTCGKFQRSFCGHSAGGHSIDVIKVNLLSVIPVNIFKYPCNIIEGKFHFLGGSVLYRDHNLLWNRGSLVVLLIESCEVMALSKSACLGWFAILISYRVV